MNIYVYCRGSAPPNTNVITVKTFFRLSSFRFFWWKLKTDDDYNACYSLVAASIYFFFFGNGRGFFFRFILSKREKYAPYGKNQQFLFDLDCLVFVSLWAITWFPRGDKCAVYFHEFFSFNASQLHGNSSTKITSHKHDFPRYV